MKEDPDGLLLVSLIILLIYPRKARWVPARCSSMSLNLCNEILMGSS